MDVAHIPPIDAELALAEIQARREQSVDAGLTPGWFWPSIGALMLTFVAAVETGVTWVIAVGAIAYAIGLSTLILLVVSRARVQVRPELIGAEGALAIGGFTLGLVAVGVGLGLALDAAGVPWPATLACVPVALGLAFGGPRVMAYIRNLVLSRLPAATR